MAEFRIKRGQKCADCGERLHIGHRAKYVPGTKRVVHSPTCPKEAVDARAHERR